MPLLESCLICADFAFAADQVHTLARPLLYVVSLYLACWYSVELLACGPTVLTMVYGLW